MKDPESTTLNKEESHTLFFFPSPSHLAGAFPSPLINFIITLTTKKKISKSQKIYAA
jgi:hypothetical protein